MLMWMTGDCNYMHQNNKQIQTIKNKLDIFHNKLHKLAHGDPTAIIYVCKQICCEFMYWLAYIRYYETGATMLATITSCVNLIKVIVGSVEVEKYGHMLPELSTTLAYYMRYIYPSSKITNNPSRHQLQQRIQKTQASSYFKHIRTHSISTAELTYLKSANINNFLQTVLNNEVVLPNNQCVCCSQIFVNGLPVVNCNPIFGRVLAVEGSKMDKITVSKSINSVCNGGGGVILGGAITSNGCLQVQGIKYNLASELDAKQKQIEQAMTTNIPPCFMQLDRVVVRHQYFQPLQNIEQDQLRICFRILVRPHNLNSLSFIKIQNKGYANIYELHHPDYPKAVLPSQHYTLMHNQYRRRFRYKLLASSHQNILCQKPLKYSLKIFVPTFQQAAIHGLKNHEQNETKPVVYEDEPIFPFQYTSLLIVGAQKDDRHIENFQAILHQSKKIFRLYKPFKESFKGGGRSVWLISHKFTFVDLFNSIKKFEEKCEEGAIKVMAVSEKLEISSDKFTEYYEGMLEKRFRERYHKVIQKSKVNKEIFQFENKNQAIYAYLILEQYQFKPYFVK